MVAIDSSQSVAPYHSLIPMQPRPCADTVSWPSLVVRMLFLLLLELRSLAALRGQAGPRSRSIFASSSFRHSRWLARARRTSSRCFFSSSMRSASPAPDLTSSAYRCMSRTGIPVARSLVSSDSQSRSPSLNRRRPSPPRSMSASRPIRSYQRSVCWERPHLAAASPMLQVVTYTSL